MDVTAKAVERMTDPADQQLALWSKALCHPTRIKILRELAARQTCMCGELVEELQFAQSTVSEHLRVLKQAGLVAGWSDGPRSCYCVDADTLRRFRVALDGLFSNTLT